MQIATTQLRLPTRDRCYSVNEAATYLGLSTPYLNRLRATGGGPPFFKIGARVVYAPADLDDWLAKHRRTSTSDTGDRG
jgi:predicted DNA-binding transcriptional regulator AlpA